MIVFSAVLLLSMLAPTTLAPRCTKSATIKNHLHWSAPVSFRPAPIFRMEAEREGAVEGPNHKSGPYGSRMTLVVCPEAARNLGRAALRAFIHSLSCDRVNSIVPSGAWTSTTYSEDAVLKSFCRAS